MLPWIFADCTLLFYTDFLSLFELLILFKSPLEFARTLIGVCDV